MSKPITLSLIVISFIIGLSVGFALSPEYRIQMSSKQSGMVELGQPDKYLDLRYLNNMIAHHQSAINLCQQTLKHTKRPELQKLSEAIITADTEGIKTLYQYKKDWYSDTRQVTLFTKTNLGSYDENFDLRFLNAMIIHHDEAIASAKEVRTKSTRNEVLNLANEVIQNLSANKTQLLEWRAAWYKI